MNKTFTDFKALNGQINMKPKTCDPSPRDKVVYTSMGKKPGIVHSASVAKLQVIIVKGLLI